MTMKKLKSVYISILTFLLLLSACNSNIQEDINEIERIQSEQISNVINETNKEKQPTKGENIFENDVSN